jgi:hypothetical protein
MDSRWRLASSVFIFSMKAALVFDIRSSAGTVALQNEQVGFLRL